MKHLTFCLLSFGIIILSAKLSVSEASPQTDSLPPEHKPAVLSFLETLWQIVLSPFMLFFASLDYASKLGERTGAYLLDWYNLHLASTPVTEPPGTETNEIPQLVKNIPGEKRENILHRINVWLKSKTEVFRRPRHNESVITPNTTDWQYPSDLSEESGQDATGLNWFYTTKKININEITNHNNQANETTSDGLLASNVTHHRFKIFSAAGKKLGKARDAVVGGVHRMGRRGRLAYDWVIWKLLAKHKNITKFFGEVNSTDSSYLSKRITWRRNPNNPNLTFDPWSNSTSSYVCDDTPNPVCAIDNVRGYTIFVNSCKMNMFNFDHLTNFTVYPTDVCLGLFIKYPEKFFQSKKE